MKAYLSGSNHVAEVCYRSQSCHSFHADAGELTRRFSAPPAVSRRRATGILEWARVFGAKAFSSQGGRAEALPELEPVVLPPPMTGACKHECPLHCFTESREVIDHGL